MNSNQIETKNKLTFSEKSLRVPFQERINFARHLSIIIKAGLPVFEGLKIIRRQTTSKKLVKIIDQLIYDVNNGQFLADSLGKYRNIFGDFFISIVRVGETSGTLAGNLTYLAEEMEKSKDLQSKVRSALIYPIIILIATLGITGLLVFFIFPKVIPVFTSLKVDLPPTTRAMIGSFNFVTNYGWYLLAALILVPVGFRLMMFVTKFKYAMHRTMLYLPVVSPLVVNVNMTSFTRVLGILLKSGIKIVEAVTITSETFNNLAYQQALFEAAAEVQKGSQFSSSLNKQTRLFPPLLSGMIEIGENTGNLEENLAYLSEYYEKEVSTSIGNLTSFLEPALILIMGLIVGFVALSIITPIYSLTEGLKVQ